jgi:hypothetical protein
MIPKGQILYVIEIMSQRGLLRNRVDVYAELSKIV